MKLLFSKRRRFSLLTLSAIMLGFAAASYAGHDRDLGWGGGRLVIKRAPDLGNYAYVEVKIDGAVTDGVLYAQGYEAPLPTGRHVIQVRLAPAHYSYWPSTTILNVHRGQTYSFV